MFMSRLNDAQRRSFLALTTKMALADGKVKPEEVALLEELAHAFGQKTPVPADEIYGMTNAEPFDTRESRVITLVGMLVIAFADDHFHVDESAVVTETAKAFEIEDEELNAMKQWAARQADLLHDLHKFFAAS